MLILELPPDVEAHLMAAAKKHEISVEAYILEMLQRYSEELASTGEVSPLLQLVDSVHADIPDEEWKKVPEDLSTQYKQHLYGQQKEKE